MKTEPTKKEINERLIQKYNRILEDKPYDFEAKRQRALCYLELSKDAFTTERKLLLIKNAIRDLQAYCINAEMQDKITKQEKENAKNKIEDKKWKQTEKSFKTGASYS